MGLLIEIDDIKQHSIIDSNVDDSIIKQTLIDVQEVLLEPILTKNLYNKFLSFANSGSTMPTNYNYLFINYIRKVLISGVVVMLPDNLIYKFKQSGINKSKENAEQETIDYKEIEALRKEKNKIYYHHATKLKDYLINNSSKFPEFKLDNDKDGDIDNIDYDVDIVFY